LSLEIAGLGFASPERQRYRYMLEGLEQGWNEVGADRRIVSYTGLPPGTYTFRVQGTNDDGIWNEQTTTLVIIITPPWRGIWWFRALGVVCIAGAARARFWVRVRAIEQRDRVREERVSERTARLQTEIEERTLAEAALRKANLELERLAVLDELTKVANRRRF